MRRALVLGLARSGRAAALALARRGVEVVGADRNVGLEVDELRAAGTRVELGSDDPALLHGADVLVKSPGVPGEAPLVVAARERGVPVWSEIELGARLFPNPIVGVTGTNGKTTTAELVGAIFRADGRLVEVAGNIGRPVTSLEPDPAAWLVLEVSSFQLEDVDTFHARVGILLNVEPDHLDRYDSLEAYHAAKLRLFERQAPDDAAVLPRGHGPVPGGARRYEFRWDDPLPAEPSIPGAHNRENAAAATAAARAAGVADAVIAEALRTFPGVPHRLEPIAEIGGVRYVNDSKATNTAAARRALAAFDAPLHLILGGSRKGERFSELASAAAAANVAAAYLIGETAPELADALDAASVVYRHCATLERAVAEAARAAVPGEIVLLSPACASYDQFRDFEHRGETFRRLVEQLR